MSNHTYKNPIVFVVVYVSEPGLQMDVSVFETEKDAVIAALAGIKERAPHFNIDFEGALLKYGSEELIDEWHSLTRLTERIEVFQSPINILKGEVK